MAALTVRMIEAIRPRDKPFKVTIDRGLQLRVAPDGRRTLLVRYTVKGYPDERQYSLPREYGDGPGQIKLADAKAEAARIRALARDGIDWPEQQAQELQKAGEQRQLARGAGTHLRRSAPGVRRTQTPQQRRPATQGPHQGRLPGDGHRWVASVADGQRFADGELVALANLRLSDITPDAIRRTFERCARRSTRRATYAMQVLRAVLRWHGVVIADNPLGKDTAGRDRIVLAPAKGDPSPIPPERLGAWWNAAREAGSRVAGDYYRFQLLTGCRGVEIHGHKNLGYPPLRVADVDLQGARVTLRDTKNRSDHRILLSRQALAIARAHCEGRAPEEPLFPIIDARKTLKAIGSFASVAARAGRNRRWQLAKVAESERYSLHGLMICTPLALKSATLRVTTVMPWTRAVAAIIESRSLRRSGTCNRAHCCATEVSMGRTRPAKAGGACPSSQARMMAPCFGSRRSICRTPISSSSTVMTETYRLPAGTPVAQTVTAGCALPDLALRSSETTFVSSRYVTTSPRPRSACGPGAE